MALGFFQRLYYRIFLSDLDLSKLNKEQQEITEINVRKHTRIFFLMLLVIVYTYFMISNYYFDKIDIVVTSLFGVMFVSGTAWFAITFGAIPVRFMDFAINVTSYLFASFAVSISAVFVAASIALPLLSPVLLVAFFTLYYASVKYDVADALKLGLEETMYEHAKVGRVYFVRELDRGKPGFQKKSLGQRRRRM